MPLNQSSSPTRPSNATRCSLRGGEDRSQPLLPLDPSDGDFEDIDIHISADGPIRPPPSARTTPAAAIGAATTAYHPHASLSPLQDYATSPHLAGAHQRSLTESWFDNCQPFLNRATSTLQQHTSRASFHSPTKSLASFIPSRTAIESTASQPKIRAIQNWFNGSSASVNLGIAPNEEDDSDAAYDSDSDDGNMGIFTRSPALTRAADTTPKQSPQPKSTNTPTSKFAWLLSTPKNTSTAPPAPPAPTYHNPSDELLTLNIQQSLFPHGSANPLDPTSFHDLLSHAESLLTRYQTSYQQLSSALNAARAEHSAQADELDEAETRARHLKMQLETMAARASEQDAQMQRLMEELQFERQARREEEAARKRSLTLIRGPAGHVHNGSGKDGMAPRRRTRVSGSDVSVDSGFESEYEADSEVASVFSRNHCLSPTDTLPSSATPSLADLEATLRRPQPEQRRSTYEKVRDGSVQLERNGGWGCANCEGGAQSAVWGRLAREREECNALRRRVEVLEDAVEGALSVVDGRWG